MGIQGEPEALRPNKGSEVTLASQKLGAALAARMRGRQQVAGAQREDAGEVHDNPRLGTMQPEEESSDEDERGKRWGVIGMRGAGRSAAGGISYGVVGEACEETNGEEEVTWEHAEGLKTDKRGRRLGGFWRSRAEKERKGR